MDIAKTFNVKEVETYGVRFYLSDSHPECKAVVLKAAQQTQAAITMLIERGEVDLLMQFQQEMASRIEKYSLASINSIVLEGCLPKKENDNG